jgi:hypothetical protein
MPAGHSPPVQRQSRWGGPWGLRATYPLLSPPKGSARQIRPEAKWLHAEGYGGPFVLGLLAHIVGHMARAG